MAMKPMKKPVAKTKTGVKAKPNPGKDYMKPVGGTKQKGYVTPGGSLFDVKADRKKSRLGFDSVTRRTGKGVGEPKSSRYAQVGIVKTGINPAAMKATSGNPKPTTAQIAAGKKASAKAKAKAAATKKELANTVKKPATGVYKRGNP